MKTFFLVNCAAWAIIAAAAFADSQVSEQEQAPQAPGYGSVEMRIEGVSSPVGVIYVSLFISANGFPDAPKSAYDSRSFPATIEPVVLTYTSIPAGRIAVSVFHDADGNKVLNTNFLGIPKEDYGFSQNARGRFGPPSFDTAAVSLAAGATESLVIKLH